MKQTWLAAVAVAAVAAIGTLRSEAANPILLGLPGNDAEKHNVEFQQYNRMVPVYRENGIRAALMEDSFFMSADCTEEQLLSAMKKFNVVHLATTEEGINKFDEVHRKRAAVVGRALARYVEGGGGLFLQPQTVRYVTAEDEVYWNAVLAPLGLQLLHEGAFDKTRSFEGRTLGKDTFWHTHNIKAHPVTKGVSQLYLPLHSFFAGPGIAAMQYGPKWQILMRGEKEARSYRCNADNTLDLNAEGTYAAAPPVLAVRELGKGRIVCYPIAPLFTGMNHRNPLWPDIVECNGDRAAGEPSHSMKMQMNAYTWLAEPSRGLTNYGTYTLAPYKPAQFAASVDWDQIQFGTGKPYTYPDGQTFDVIPPTNGIRGIFGLHSDYSDGKGPVAAYVKAAKAAGLSFVVFNDPLEKLTKETLERLKADCAAASAAGDFYACPGIEFTDGIGNRWAAWGEKIVFPPDVWKADGKEYKVWDGKAVRYYGYYVANIGGYFSTALLDYEQLAQNKTHAENLGVYYHCMPFVYALVDKTRLIADNLDGYLAGLSDLRWLAVASFTRTYWPSDVATAAAICFTGISDLKTAKASLNTGLGSSSFTLHGGQYASEGPVIAAWQQIDAQMENNWRTTRGAQRVRLWFVARSAAGIAEVEVLDGKRGTVRRFLGHGAKEFAREFELVGDQQHYLVLQVTDTAGKRAVSGDIRIYSYKTGLFRCGDNYNLLGPTAMLWNPGLDGMFLNAAKQFRNGEDFGLHGWDSGSPGLGVPMPAADLVDGINIKEAGGIYPKLERGTSVGHLNDFGINSYNLQIVSDRMSKVADNWGSERRPSPYQGNAIQELADLEYYERVHTLVAPMERVDMYVTFNARRNREGRKDYRGAILWHEGEIRFKKDCTLQGPVPIPLVNMRCPTDLGKNVGTTFMVTDADGVVQTGVLRDDKAPMRRAGRVKPGGYAALMTTPVGYHGLIAPADADFAYTVTLGAPRSDLTVGMGRDGQTVKAGEVLKYRFGLGSFADEQASSAVLESTVGAMNMGGGHAGYPVNMKVGDLEDATFFFTAKAKKNEAVFVLGPQSLLIDLPIRVRGLENNGCAAVYSTLRPWYRFVPTDAAGTAWFQESIDKTNEMWVGNPFVCDNKGVKLTLVVDGQAEGKPPFVEVHNPTDKSIKTRVWSPSHAPVFGGGTWTMDIPAGDSIRWQIGEKKTL